MKITATIKSVQRTQYGMLEIQLGRTDNPQIITVHNTMTAARAYTVGREIEITVKPK